MPDAPLSTREEREQAQREALERRLGARPRKPIDWDEHSAPHLSEDARSPTTDAGWRWRPIDAARKGEMVIVRGPGVPEQRSIWSKVSHVSIYGWLDLSGDDPEDVSLLRPQPTEWRFMCEEADL